MEAKIYNQKGKEAGSIKLSESVFGVKWNADLVHQVVTSLRTDRRHTVAHTKTRGEVRGGGKKPWQQKGTGRARHGSSRSPIWVGGGVAHGPRNEKNFARKINKKMKAKALFAILTRKFKDNEIIFVDKFDFKAPKTADAKAVIGALASIKGFEDLSSKRKNAAYLGFSDRSASKIKSFQNIGSVLVDEFRNINPVDVLNYKYVVIENPEVSLAILSNKLPARAE
jgi:large subunit ribosomal protein L4